MARPITMATCHPDRRVQGGGLCSNCYHRDYYRSHPEYASRPRNRREATCHPDKKAYARGLCAPCYDLLPDRAQKKPVQRRKSYLKSLYGLTPEQYDDLLAKQDGVCAICGEAPNGSPLHVDHDHKSGAVRGILCNSCNAGVGLFRDDPVRVDRAASYLRGAR